MCNHVLILEARARRRARGAGGLQACAWLRLRGTGTFKIFSPIPHSPRTGMRSVADIFSFPDPTTHVWRAKRNKNQNATLRALPRNIATWIPQYYAVGVTTSSDSDPVILRDRGNAVCSDPVILRGSFTRKGACALVRAVRRWRAFIGTDLTIGARSIHNHCAFCLCACA